MDTLAIIPDSTGYSIVDGNEIVSTNVPGGPSRTRRDFQGAPAIVTLQWTLNLIQYDYWRAFWRQSTKNGSQPFLCKLAFDAGELQLYTCKVVPGTFGTPSQKGAQYVVAMSLEVQPQPEDATFDAALVALYGSYTDGSFAVLSALETLVNVEFPAI